MNPSITVQADATTGQPTEQKSTSGAAHVVVQSGTTNLGASVDVNSAIVADVDAAVPAAAGLRLVGFACRESAAAAAAATFIIVHGATGAAGTPIVPVELAANGSYSAWFGPEGIATANGISIDWIAGTVDVHLFHKTVV